VGLTLASTHIARFALKFGPPEYVGIMLLGLTIVTYLARGSLLKALIMAAFGLFLSQIGMDSVNARFRFTLGILRLSDGIDLICMVMGLFGISEVFLNLERAMKVEIIRTKIKDLFPSREEWRRSIGAILRGTVLGFFLGVIPGGGTIIASFASYGLEKKISRHPERFGAGAIEGSPARSRPTTRPRPAPWSPCSPSASLQYRHSLALRGPPHPWDSTQSHAPCGTSRSILGVIASMYLGNAMLLVLNLPLVWIWVQVLRVPYRILFPLILLFCLIGAYSVNNSLIDVFIMILFGVLGYILRKLEYEPAPLILAFILGRCWRRPSDSPWPCPAGVSGSFGSGPLPPFCIIATVVVLAASFIEYYSRKHKGSLLGADL